MKTIKEIAHATAWQIYEEIGMSKHSVERMEELIAERLTEQKVKDIDKAYEWFQYNAWSFGNYAQGDSSYEWEMAFECFRKAIEE